MRDVGLMLIQLIIRQGGEGTIKVARCWCILQCIISWAECFTLLNTVTTMTNERIGPHICGPTVKTDLPVSDC